MVPMAFSFLWMEPESTLCCGILEFLGCPKDKFYQAYVNSKTLKSLCTRGCHCRATGGRQLAYRSRVSAGVWAPQATGGHPAAAGSTGVLGPVLGRRGQGCRVIANCPPEPGPWKSNAGTKTYVITTRVPLHLPMKVKEVQSDIKKSRAFEI